MSYCGRAESMLHKSAAHCQVSMHVLVSGECTHPQLTNTTTLESYHLKIGAEMKQYIEHSGGDKASEN